MAQVVRAVLFAKAIAATLTWRRSMMFLSTDCAGYFVN
jgi:hypothetical protein